MNHFAIFGTHPRLSLAEFRSISPKLSMPLLIGSAGLFETDDWNGAELMRILGGTIKLGDVFFETTNEELNVEAIADQLADRLPKRSFDFGWTVYGGSNKTNERISRLAIPFKKALKARGLPSRWVTGKDGDIAPAAVAKLKLTTEGLDICLFVEEKRTFVGYTTHVQDADAWSLRDFGRPARDEVVGMLPPKLARMMVNLARIPDGGTLLDPFCGGGTIAMEAGLATRAARIISTDADAIQTANTVKNTAWLIQNNILPQTDEKRFEIFQSDIRALGSAKIPKIDAVVTEGYLGPPLSGQETQETLKKNVQNITKLWQDTLTALKPLLKPDGCIVCIWPSFKTSHGVARVELDLELSGLGYRLVNPIEGWDNTRQPILYARPDQRVMRRVVVLEKAD